MVERGSGRRVCDDHFSCCPCSNCSNSLSSDTKIEFVEFPFLTCQFKLFAVQIREVWSFFVVFTDASSVQIIAKVLCGTLPQPVSELWSQKRMVRAKSMYGHAIKNNQFFTPCLCSGHRGAFKTSHFVSHLFSRVYRTSRNIFAG